MSKLASISVFASPTPEIEAGFSTKEVGSDHFLLYQIGLLTQIIGIVQGSDKMLPANTAKAVVR